MKTNDVYATRDYLWRELVRVHVASLERFSDEQIEIAYLDLYGYDTNVQELFTEAISQMKTIEEDMNKSVLELTQREILRLDPKQPIHSAQIGNALRGACSRVAAKHKELMDLVMTRFRDQMMKVVGEQSDSKIVKKKVKIESKAVLLSQQELQQELQSRGQDLASSIPSLGKTHQ